MKRQIPIKSKKQPEQNRVGATLLRLQKSCFFHVLPIPFYYKKIYLQINNTVSTYINGVFFLLFPQIRLINV